ncbi:MAG: hypothetical protein PHF67_05595 [Candidatus Nanoarchaeia archaeon]|nr:hypothetical protein [Candidatus Nanoarchaeia archaeon]
MADLFVRSKHNPIIKPNPKNSWESLKVYNPGAIFHNEKYHLFYRAMGIGENWHSALGYAVSEDGEHFERFDKPAFERDPSKPIELRGYEDPRIAKIGDTFYMTYAVYDGKTPRLHVATSKDLIKWKTGYQVLKDFRLTKQGGVFVKWSEGKPIEKDVPSIPEKDERTKAGAIFPEKINGKFWMLFNEYRIWLANSKDGIEWKVEPELPFIGPRKNTELFDNVFVEAGPTPIKTNRGWLVFYHGINDAIQYHLGVLLLDLKNPKKILYRSGEPVFGPKEKYELSGIVDIIPGAMNLLEQGKRHELKLLLKEATAKGFMPQVTFTTAAVVNDGIIRLFYGAGDEYICTATAKLEDVLATIPKDI